MAKTVIRRKALVNIKCSDISLETDDMYMCFFAKALFVNPKYESSPSPPFYVLLKALVCAYIERGGKET